MNGVSLKSSVSSSQSVNKCHTQNALDYQHELKYLLLSASLLQEEAVRVRALEDTSRLQQLTHAVLDEPRVRGSAIAWTNKRKNNVIFYTISTDQVLDLNAELG